uniref:Endonuclease/exonuclease/phosphatase domain-containing protein n=1 Tax=Eutreptiella gymnastica TaxID=73025 RepID=A0A7S4LMD2_9EUGL
MSRVREPPLPTAAGGQISVLSYNLLAPCYVRVHGQPWNAYAHCQDQWLEWKGRQDKLASEIIALNADVVCLQEVVYEERAVDWRLPKWMEPLYAAGYVGVTQKSALKDWDRQAERNKRVLGKRLATGLAILYREQRFQLDDEITGNRSLSIFLSETNAEDPQTYAVMTCHLEGNQEYTEKQRMQFLSLVKKVPPSFRGHVIVCGDFNNECLPGSSLMECIETQKFVKLQEVPTGPSWAEPGSALRLDHVLHSDRLEPCAVYDKMHDEVLQTGLPNATCPSDHLPVGAVFSIKKRARSPDLLADLSDEVKASLTQKLEDFTAQAPAPKKPLTAEDKLELQAHSARKRQWVEGLPPAHRAFVKSIEKGNRKGTK